MDKLDFSIDIIIKYYTQITLFASPVLWLLLGKMRFIWLFGGAQSKRLHDQKLQNRAARIILNAKKWRIHALIYDYSKNRTRAVKHQTRPWFMCYACTPRLYHWALLYLEEARQSFFSQTVEAKNMADFCRIWRHLTPFLWQRLKVVTASQAQFWARGCSHTPLDLFK